MRATNLKFNWPLACPAMEAKEMIMDALLELPVTDDDPATTPHRLKEKILLVDDDAAIRQTLTRLLAEDGYLVLPAATGTEAVEFASHVDFDLVLLDLKMPDLDGWDTFEQLTRKKPRLPVIIITARPHQQFTAVAAGIGALMEKPLDLEKLFLTIRDLLDEPDEVRLARVAGRLSGFHYVPPVPRESSQTASPWRSL